MSGFDEAHRQREAAHGKREPERGPDRPDSLKRLSGDPDVPYDDLTDAPDPELVGRAEQMVKRKIDTASEAAAEAGMKSWPWWQVDGGEDYHEPSSGLDEPTKQKAYEWEMGPKREVQGPMDGGLFEGLRSATREDWEGLRLTHEFLTGLSEEFADRFPGEAQDPAVVRAAAQRVAQEMQLQGTRDVMRRIARDREDFLYRVSDVILLYGDSLVGGGDEGHGDEGQGAHRTADLGSMGRPGRSMKEQEAGDDSTQPMVEDLRTGQRRDGYV